MVTHFIFDLNHTLYKLNNLSYNKKLNNLLNKLKIKNKLYIFSNNSHIKGTNILKKLKLKTLFNNNVNFSSNKPNINGYLLFIDKFNLNGRVIFFDDSISNLRTAKTVGWKTVLINKSVHKNIKYIDYSFSSIEDAVHFFISN